MDLAPTISKPLLLLELFGRLAQLSSINAALHTPPRLRPDPTTSPVPEPCPNAIISTRYH